MTKAFQDLTATEISELNLLAWESVNVRKIELSLADCIDFLGLRECLPDETPHFVHSGKRYLMEKSRTNRPIDMAAVKRLMAMMRSGHWVFNGESLIKDSDDQTGSAQHRLCAHILLQWELGTSNPYRAIVVTQVPPSFMDTIDTGRSRSQKDIFSRDQSVLSVDTLEDINGASFGDRAPAIRKSLLGDLNTAINFVRLRSNGKNVQTGGQAERQTLHRIRRAFDGQWIVGVELDDDDNEVTKQADNALDYLVSMVYRYDMGQGDKPTWSKTIGRPVVAAALALYSMQNSARWQSHDAQWQGTIDFEQCEQFLRELSVSFASADGKLSRAIHELRTSKGQKLDAEGKVVKGSSRNELKREFVFGAVVRMIQLFFTGETVQGVIPKAKKNVKTYPAFGGVDCGYIPPTRGKKTEDVEESDEESDESEE